MMKKLSIVIAIAVFFISGCVPLPTVTPPAAPTEEPSPDGITPPAPVADQWSGWSQVSGGGITDVALAAAAFNNKLYLFSKGIDDKREYVNILDTAGNWSGATQVPGGGTTDVSLSAAAFNNKLYLFGKGINDKREYVNMLDVAGNWSGWAQVPGGGTTDVALNAAAFNNKLYVLSKGIGDKLIYFNAYDGSYWSGWTEVPGGATTDVAPAAAVFNDKLYVLAEGSQNGLIYSCFAGKRLFGAVYKFQRILVLNRSKPWCDNEMSCLWSNA